MKEAPKTIISALNSIRRHTLPKLAIMEGHVNCNRHCAYCTVPQRWDKEKSSTVKETCQQIDWAYNQGCRILNFRGGESLATSPPPGPFIPQCADISSEDRETIAKQKEEKIKQSPFITKEGLTFAQHTMEVVSYASKKGMVTHVTTNGDFVDQMELIGLRLAGLDVQAFSLHNTCEESLAHTVSRARMAAREGIIPIISVVFTRDRADEILKIAKICVANGILFSTGIVQEHGGGFSTIPGESQAPTLEQQRLVFDGLLELKRKTGLIRTNEEYLRHATDFPGNMWKCNPEKDLFVHIKAIGKGSVGVCQEVSTGFKVGEISLDSEEWRKTKMQLVENCKGCLYACHYESENPNLKGDFRTLLNMVLIRSGHSGLVRLLGRRALKEQLSEIKSIPMKEDEEFQVKMKAENKILSKMNDVIFVATLPFEVLIALPIVGGKLLVDKLKKKPEETL